MLSSFINEYEEAIKQQYKHRCHSACEEPHNEEHSEDCYCIECHDQYHTWTMWNGDIDCEYCLSDKEEEMNTGGC